MIRITQIDDDDLYEAEISLTYSRVGSTFLEALQRLLRFPEVQKFVLIEYPEIFQILQGAYSDEEKTEMVKPILTRERSKKR